MIRFPIYLALFALVGCGASKTVAPIRDARPPATKPLAAKVSAGHYRVQAGDTLYKIAFEHGVDYRDLAQWNRLTDPDRIQADQVLRVTPPKAEVTTAALPTAAAVQSRTLAVEPVVYADTPEAAPDIWAWPSRGGLLSRYGEGMNKGIDIAGPRGQAVQAAASGRVVYAGSGLRGYGKLIIIRHGKTLLSAYAHNARLLVAEGHTVARGQTIAEMGDSDTDRVKLHFEIREYGKPVDPLNYLPKPS